MFEGGNCIKMGSIHREVEKFSSNDYVFDASFCYIYKIKSL